MRSPSVSLLLGVSVLLLSGLSVSADQSLTLKISANPVMTGDDVTLYCEDRNSDLVKAYFSVNETRLQSNLEVLILIKKVQPAQEGLYSCSNNEWGKSPTVWLKVKDPPTASDPHTTALYCATAFNNPDPPDSSTVTSPLSVLRLCLHVLVFCPYCICTVLMMWFCCDRKTGNKLVVSVEMTQCAKEYDDISADVITDLRAAQ